MKPWEETWEAEIWTHDVEQRPLWCVETNHDQPKAGAVALPIFEFNAPFEAARAKLAAAAPEMARLLFEAEWSAEEWDSGGGERKCWWCWSTAPYDQEVSFKGPRERCAPRHHKPDCALIATLRKAGVLP